jgi:hypothetical protein
MNQSPNSLLENPCKGDHEAGNSQKGNVGFGIPVVAITNLRQLSSQLWLHFTFQQAWLA